MSEIDTTATPLALVFGDAGASEHVRAMLTESDARIVYDVGIGDLDTSALSQSGATVVLVNLDEIVEEHFDELYASLDDGSYRVVFNDGSRSAALSGWEQARWARHLGAKLRDDVNVDPPRPAHAEAVEVAPEDAWMTDALGLLDAAGDTVKTPAAEAARVPEIAMESDLGPEPASLASGGADDEPDVEGLPSPSEWNAEPVAASDSTVDDWELALDELPPTEAERTASAEDVIEFDDEIEAEMGAEIAPDEGSPAPATAEMIADTAGELEANSAPATSADSPADRVETSMQDFPSAEADWSEFDFDSEAATLDADTLATDSEVSELLHAMDEAAADSETDAGPALVTETTVSEDDSPLDLAWPEPTEEDPATDLARAQESEPIKTTPDDAPIAPVSEPEVTPAEIDSSQWALVDYALDEISEESVDKSGQPVASIVPGAAAAEALASREFGIELMDPIEYLSPEAPVDRGDELFAAPELMSMREALAPVDVSAQSSTTDQAATATPLPRLVVLGASIGGPDAVREFLAALPPRFPATFVLVQHLGSEFVDLMITQLGKSSALPVRKAAHLERAVPGEVLVVPRGRQMIVSRNGDIELRELPSTSAHDPSINLTMAMAAETFAGDALGIVFSGMANDAVSGALEIAANGGSVWVQDPDHCVVSSMVDAVIAAGVVRFNGTPSALAQHLIDEYGTETPA